MASGVSGASTITSASVASPLPTSLLVSELVNVMSGLVGAGINSIQGSDGPTPQTATTSQTSQTAAPTVTETFIPYGATAHAKTVNMALGMIFGLLGVVLLVLVVSLWMLKRKGKQRQSHESAENDEERNKSDLQPHSHTSSPSPPFYTKNNDEAALGHVAKTEEAKVRTDDIKDELARTDAKVERRDDSPSREARRLV